MIKLENSTVINRSVADVFAYMSEPQNVPEWNALVLEAKAEGPMRQGTKVHQMAKFLGRRIDVTAEITEYEVNKKFAMKTSAPFPLVVTNLFEAAGAGTRVTAIVEGEVGGFFKLGEPIVARIAQKQFQTVLDTLKEILEAQVPAKA
jgi:uncharacterized protein YndB with AHSA1/START domain